MQETDMESRASRKSAYHRVSVGGWMGTILLSSIPVVNVILWIIWAITAKRPSRRTYAIANLILLLIVLVLIFAAFAVFGEAILTWAKETDVQDVMNVFTPAVQP